MIAKDKAVAGAKRRERAAAAKARRLAAEKKKFGNKDAFPSFHTEVEEIIARWDGKTPIKVDIHCRRRYGHRILPILAAAGWTASLEPVDINSGEDWLHIS